jgi:nitroreductase
LLQAVALGLGAAVVGAFDDRRVAQVLSLPKQEAALYLIPIGKR